jgi:hypothetical protein
MLLMALPLLFFSNPDGSYTVETRDYEARFTTDRIYFTRGKSMVALEFPGANTPTIERLEVFRLRANFFTGSDKSLKTAIPTALAYRNLYPGIDAIWRSSGHSLKSEFVVSPQSNPMSLRLRYSGARRVALAKNGGLEIHTSGGILRESPPVLYQVSMSGRRVPVEGHYRIAKSGVVSLGIGAYDRGLPLYIDPTISYSSYLGGSRTESASAVAADAAGNIYVAGHTDSPSFPVKSPLRSFGGNTDAFVVKLNPSGSQVLWATFLGGSADDRATGLALDPAGNVFVVGYTTSANFPVVQPLQAKRSGARDAFIAKIDSSGQTLLFSTYFGGSGSDTANAVAVDPSGLVYVAGETLSTNFLVKTPAQLKNGGKKDSFLLKLNSYFALEFATYLGGSGDDRATALAVSPDGSPFLAGCTASTNFPIQSAAQSALRGKQDAFVARFSPSGNSLAYSTYLGGAGSNDCAAGIAVDPNLTAFVTGVTASADFPVLGAFQNQHAGGGVDAFLTRYTAGGTMAYSTYIGGRSVDLASAIRLDSAGRAYIAGYTASINFPTASPVQTSFAGVYDGFLFRLEPSGTISNFSTFLGHTGSDAPLALALTTAGDAILAGATTSAQYPVVSPLQPARSGSSDAFLSRIASAAF